MRLDRMGEERISVAGEDEALLGRAAPGEVGKIVDLDIEET